MSELTYGMLVLSAKSSTPMPLLSQLSMTDHIPGSVFHGRAGGIAPYKEAILMPSRGRKYIVYSNTEFVDLQGLVHVVSTGSVGAASADDSLDFKTHFRNSCAPYSRPGSLLVVEQVEPFGLIGLNSNEAGLRLYGVYSKMCELLVWSNTPDLERILQQSGRREWRIYRFKEHTSLSTVVFPRRVCQRWYRWSESLPTADLKFQALEVSLLGASQQDWDAVPDE